MDSLVEAPQREPGPYSAGSDICVRKATPEDVPSLTSLHCRAFADDGHAAMALGGDFIRSIYTWQVSGPGEFVLVAEKNNRIAGFVALSRGRYMRNMILSCWPSALRIFLSKPRIRVVKALKRILVRRPVARNASELHAAFPEPYELSFIAVDNQSRGLGVAASLLLAAEEEVVARGGKTIVVGVYKHNSPSRRAFSKAGWLEVPPLETQDTVTFVCSVGEPKDLHEEVFQP
jgi:ribosomal protein S18 acetylase RimI-like enzyme